MKSLAIVSPKGGVGKTTLALNLAYSFAQLGKRTLLIDSDPQGGIGNSLASRTKRPVGLSTALQGQPIEECLIQTKNSNLSILPVGPVPWAQVSDWCTQLADPAIFGKMLAPIESEFDLAIFDTPAGLAGPTNGVLYYATHALMPIQTEPLAVRVIGQLIEVLTHLRGKGGRAKLVAVALTMTKIRDELSLSISQEVWSLFPESLVLDTMIPRDPELLQASRHGVPVALLRKRPPPITAVFDRLAAELEPKLSLSETVADDQPTYLLD
ncbi:MAG: ParA family protein [Polyangiales bacterium]